MKSLYTLNDEIYRFALQKAIDSYDFIDGAKLMVSGGIVVQLFMSDKSSTLRPTYDIDMVSDRDLTLKEKHEWGDKLSGLVELSGYPTLLDVDEALPASLSIEGLPVSLSISLNQHRIPKEFERAQTSFFDGRDINHQSLVDVVAGKIERYRILKPNLNVPERIRDFYDKMQENPDRIDFDSYKPRLGTLVQERSENTEVLGDRNLDEAINRIYGYKLRKDMYDICSILSMDRSKTGFDSQEFLGILGC